MLNVFGGSFERQKHEVESQNRCFLWLSFNRLCDAKWQILSMQKNPTRCFHYVVVSSPMAGYTRRRLFCVPWGVTLHANCRIFPDSQVTKPSKKHELYKMWLMADNARHTIMCPCCSAGISGMTTYQVTYMSDKKKSMFGISPKKINFIASAHKKIHLPFLCIWCIWG